jgi:hypothetical protein
MSDTTPDTRAQRRELLLTLLTRMERDVITAAERPLVRQLVEAEMADPALVEAKAEYDALAQRHDDLIEETQRQGDVHERTARRATELQTALGEALAEFTHETHPGYPARQSGHVNAGRIARWRAVLNPTAASAQDGAGR